MPGSTVCFGIKYFVPLCYCANIQIQTEVHVSSLIYVAPRFVIWYRKHYKNEIKHHHVWNISSDVPYMLTFFSHIGHCLYIRQQKRGTTWGETHPAQLEFVYNTMAQHTWFHYMSLNQAYVIKCRYFWCSLPEYASHHKTLVWAYMKIRPGQSVIWFIKAFPTS